jgi:hypothetical protein
MNTENRTLILVAVACAALATLALTASSVSAANIVLNGDFSSNAASFSTFPGYIGGSNPAAIDNWTKIGGGQAGVNGSGISTPFGPSNKNGATYWSFLQNNTSAITQVVTPSVNTSYGIAYLAANRSSNAGAQGRVVLADNSTTFYDSGVNTWSNTAFQAMSGQFTTPGSFDGPVVLTLSNVSPSGDNTVDYSNVLIDEYSAAATQKLFNGDFELAAQGGGATPTNHVGTLPAGWEFVGGQSNLVRHNGVGVGGSNQYVDWTSGSGADHYLKQTFTLDVDSIVDFGAYFNNRGTANPGNATQIYDATDTTLLYASPDVVAPDPPAWQLSQLTGVTLAAGTYVFRSTFDDFSNTDGAFVNAVPVPEPAAFALAGIGLLSLFGIGRRRSR